MTKQKKFKERERLFKFPDGGSIGRKRFRDEVDDRDMPQNPPLERGERRSLKKAEAKALRPSAFHPDFLQKHISNNLQPALIDQEAITSRDSRARRGANNINQRDPHPNSKIGMNEDLRKDLENHILERTTQNQFHNAPHNRININFPPKANYYSYGATANPVTPSSSGSLTQLQPIKGMNVGATEVSHPNGGQTYYQVNHLNNIY